MESKHAVITEGMIYKAPQKGNLHERKAGQSHFFLKISRNILWWWWFLLRETWIDEKEKSHGTEKVKLVPHHLAGELCLVPLAPVLIWRTLESQDSGTEIRVKKEADSPCTEEQ